MGNHQLCFSMNNRAHSVFLLQNWILRTFWPINEDNMSDNLILYQLCFVSLVRRIHATTEKLKWLIPNTHPALTWDGSRTPIRFQIGAYVSCHFKKYGRFRYSAPSNALGNAFNLKYKFGWLEMTIMSIQISIMLGFCDLGD